MSLIFNDIKKDWLVLRQGREKVPFPSLTRNLIKIPGMPGAHLQSTDIEPVLIRQPVGFEVYNDADALALKDELASWLVTMKEKPLIFPDEPDRVYYAVVQNTVEDFEKFAELRQGTIQFLCVDPYAHGSKESYPLSNVSMIPNDGTADAYPVFDLTVTEETELIYIGNLSNEDERGDRRAIYLGTDVDIDEETVEQRTLIMHDTMQSTSGWTGASDIDSGKVSGQMETDEDGFYAESYGDENDEDSKNIWVGPSLKRELPKSLRSFIADFTISNYNYKDGTGAVIGDRGVGIVEFYFRDVNGNMVCKIQFGDTAYNAAINKVLFATPEKQHVFTSDNPVNWNDFTGVLRVMRDSGYFYPRIVTYRKGKVVGTRDFGTFIPDPTGTGANEVTTIQIAVRKYHRSKRIAQRISEVKIWDAVGEFEDTGKTAVHKFEKGDQIHIDVKKNLVLVNDEPRTDLFHLDTSFFTLVEGLNELETSGNVEGTVSFVKRYM